MKLSLIIPAYNEAQRLPSFLDSVRAFLDGSYASEYEVVVVDDGSRDGMPRQLELLAPSWPELKVLRHPANRGKGTAVKTGMLAAAGEIALFADADGATPIDEAPRLIDAIAAGADIAIGSRLIPDPAVARRRTAKRALSGRLFALAVKSWLGLEVQDTQCGFKMFRRDVGREIFQAVEESGYLFDLELLLLAQRSGYQVAEVAINWSDVPGGNLSVSREFLRIVQGLWRLRRKYGRS